MPKVIHPVAYQLFEAETRIRDLEKRNKALQNEVQRLKNLCKLIRPNSTKEVHYDQYRRERNFKCPDTVPSYQQATRASQNRSCQAKKQVEEDTTEPKAVLVQGVPYKFRDGRLVGREKVDCVDLRSGPQTCFGYQQHTRSSKRKLKPLVRYIETEQPNSQISPELSDSPHTPNVDQSEVPSVTDSDTLVDIDSTESEDESSFGPVKDDLPYAYRRHIRIPTKIGYRILFHAFRLAQDIYYNAARKYWPTLWRRAFPGGPHEVQFGHSELQHYSTKSHVTSIPGTSGYTFTTETIYSITSLRNAICHFGKDATHWSMGKYDSYLEDVHRLATWVNDDARASKVKGLRAELRMEIEKVAEEIQSLEPLALLPLVSQCQWKSHHLVVFEGILAHRYTRRSATFPQARRYPL